MNRLSWELPDFTRIAWASAEARDYWQHRIKDVNGAWLRLERWSVIEEARDSCLTVVEASYLPEMSRWAGRCGCVVLPISRVSRADVYATSITEPAKGEPWQYRVILTRPHLVEAWYDIWDNPDDRHNKIGQMLGFPDCCRRFFLDHWVSRKHRDLTWPQAINTEFRPGDKQSSSDGHSMVTEVDIQDGDPSSSTLWRWMGVRLVPHLACGFRCSETARQAQVFADVAKDRELDQQLVLAREILSWPVEWSALHGVAEIKSPIHRISTRTDATGDRYRVRVHGQLYPEHGATGLGFPFQMATNSSKIQVSAPADEALTDLSTGQNLSKVARLNGFHQYDAMQRAHDMVMQVVDALQPDRRQINTVVDPGCGDGTLLQRFVDKNEWYWPIGVDCEPQATAAARDRLVRHRGGQGTVVCGNIFNPDTWTQALGPHGDVSVLLLMPGRLLEVKDATALRHIIERARQVLVYAYADSLKHNCGRFDSSEYLALGLLCEEAGLGPVELQHHVKREAGEAAILVREGQ